MQRFIKEYANFQINNFKNNELMQTAYKHNAINSINKAVKLCEQGFITVNECMSMINKPSFEY
ncbi:MAG: hypothetical protein MJ230_07205 [bacterium]|nr:hypothetical protein [bacterium]